MDTSITEDMLVPQYQPSASDLFSMASKPKSLEEYDIFEKNILESFVFNPCYIISAKEINQTMTNTYNFKLGHNNHLPKLMERFMTEHPNLGIYIRVE